MKKSKLIQLITTVAPMIDQLSQREAEREKRAESRQSTFVAGVLSGFSHVGARLDSVGVRLDSAVVTLREYVADTVRATTRVVDIFDRAERHQREHRDDVTVTLTSAEMLTLLNERIGAISKHIADVRVIVGRARDKDLADRSLAEVLTERSELVFLRDHLSVGKVFELSQANAVIFAPADYDSILERLARRFEAASTDEG
jgi:hypothetical protein